MIGTIIGQYKIVQKLGEGGMGVVYKAEDTNLDRLVALRFLPEKLTATEEEQARFVQEAKAAATLNHPNVCTIHDIKEHEGHRFIVMEHVEGATLRERAPGYQVRKHHDQLPGPGESDGFRAGKTTGFDAPDKELEHDRDFGVHGAGADSGGRG
ncbi:MAG: protein kinase [Bacteroidota bacterium]